MSLLEKSSSYEISRRTQPFYAKKGTYSLGQQVQIEVDVQREMIDFENSRLVFDAEFSGQANATANNWFASQCIKNLRVKTLAGQMLGNEIREYRAWAQMCLELKSNDSLNASYDDVMEGAAVQNLDGVATRQYAHKFLTHILSVKEYYPAHFHQGIIIEFDLPSSANPDLVYQDSGGAITAPTITFTNVKYVADLVQLRPEMEKQLVRMMDDQQLFVDYHECLTQENTMANSSNLQAYDIVGIDGRVKNIFAYTIRDDTRAAGAEDEQLFSTWGRNNLSKYRFKLGANYLNYESIECSSQNKSAERIYELMKALDYHQSDRKATRAGDSALTPTILDTKRFAVGVKVDKAMAHTEDVISSMVDKDRNNVRVELFFGSAPGGTGVIYTHVELDKRLQILSGSIIRNVRS